VSVYHEPRKNVIKLAFISLVVIIIIRLFTLQVVTSKYKILAEDQGMFRKVVYPDRGIIFDRKKNAILQNTSISDLMVTPNKVKGIDTALLCEILEIDTAQFKKKLIHS
jgi:penicillin-binding protein 2